MSTGVAGRAEVEKLCDMLCEGVISADAIKRLEALVRADTAARRAYVEIINLHAALRSIGAAGGGRTVTEASACQRPGQSCGGAPTARKVAAPPADGQHTHGESRKTAGLAASLASERRPGGVENDRGTVSQGGGDTSPPEPSPCFDKGFRSPLRTAAQTIQQLARRPVAASLLLAWFFMFAVVIVMGVVPLRNWQSAGHRATFRDGRLPHYVASLTGTQQCQWDKAGSPVRYLDRLYTGQRLDLSSGVARITYDCGARVLLRGPATYIVGPPGQGHLELGEVAAMVPRQAIGFTLGTPSAIVVDQGTEFGLRVDRDERAEVHVFAGSVEAELVGNAGPTGERLRLREGRAARFDSARARIDQFAAADRQFVRKIDRDDTGAVAQRRKAAFDQWTQRSLQIRNDPSLVAYYTFDDRGERPAELVNRAAATAGCLNGILGDSRFVATRPTWTTGRWPERKGALRFVAELDQHAFVDYDRALDVSGELGLVASVRLSSGGTVLLNRNARTEKMNYQFGVSGSDAKQYAGRIHFGIGAGKQAKGTFVYSNPVVPAGDHWQQVAVTCENRTVRFYLDGRPIGKQSVRDPVFATDADMFIGWGIDPDSTDESLRVGFDGRIDELAVFHRTLSPEEIAAMAATRIPEPAQITKTEG